MTNPVDPLSDFADLRKAGITYAQEASGDIWTDYNVHDPGVTLLEQTCFALSQIAYQVALPTRDLLTNARGHFCAQDLALFKPRRVLSTYPVTRQDLAAWLCDCPDIDSVSIAKPLKAEPGRFDVTIVPSESGDQVLDPETAFRAAFADVRPLCTDLGQVKIARPVAVELHGQVEINPEALPETVAAGLYHRVGRLLTGAHDAQNPATREDVWNAPERLLAPAQRRSEQSLDLNKHLADLRKLPGIRDIGTLRLQSTELQARETSDPVYYRISLPHIDDEIGVTLTMNGAPVTLSAIRLREEFIRISAETIADATHHIDRIDWDVMKSGRHRRFAASHVDELLPALYQIPHETDTGGALFAEYRSAINQQLHEMVKALSRLPTELTADPGGPLTDAKMHRLRIALLDYLIALQGCEMPAKRHSGLHRYMSTTARHRFDVTWRLEYLFSLPKLHRARATGPGPNSPGGFLAELAILCDLDLAQKGSTLADPLKSFGLRLDDEATLQENADSEALMMVAAHNPFDMLVPEDDTALPYNAESLAELSPFLSKGALAPSFLAQLADPQSFAAMPYMGGKWLILLDPGADYGRLQRIAEADTKQHAQTIVNRLRASWRQANRRAECAHLVEHVLLGESGPVETNVADLILPGFTARTAMQSYRSYVENHVETLAPAHLHIRVHWMTASDLAEFSTLSARIETDAHDDAARSDVHTFLQTLAAKEAR